MLTPKMLLSASVYHQGHGDYQAIDRLVRHHILAYTHAYLYLNNQETSHNPLKLQKYANQIGTVIEQQAKRFFNPKTTFENCMKQQALHHKNRQWLQSIMPSQQYDQYNFGLIIKPIELILTNQMATQIIQQNHPTTSCLITHYHIKNAIRYPGATQHHIILTK